MRHFLYQTETMSSHRAALKERLLEEGLYGQVVLSPNMYETSKWRYFIRYMKQFFSNKATVYPEEFRGY